MFYPKITILVLIIGSTNPNHWNRIIIA